MAISVRRLTCAEDDFDPEALFELVVRFATSFVPQRAPFESALVQVLIDDSAWLGLAEVAAEGGAPSPPEPAGYLLGFDHPAFYANGRVAWVEEIMVREDLRGHGAGRALMTAFEAWATGRGARLVALATRRAAPFYAALGYEDSATYFRKLL